MEGNDNSIANLGIAEDTAVSLGAKFVSNSYGILGEDSVRDQLRPVLQPPGRRGRRLHRRLRQRDQLAGHQPVRDRRRRHDADQGHLGAARAGTRPPGTAAAPAAPRYEPRPSYQNNINTDCPDNKAIADLSADADPNTGLAVYDTNGEGGWLQVGGTSLSSPLITAMYALAGTPVASTYPVSYAYPDPNQSSDIFDITQGSNGGCGNVLCNAGPGWDGPTGLGTPDGVGRADRRAAKAPSPGR